MWKLAAIRRRPSYTALTGVVAVLVAGIVVIGDDQVDPPREVRMTSGAAWLSSSRVGQVTLLDGSSAEVAAQVQVAPAGNVLEVVQQDTTGYAVDQTAGTVRRVDGATFGLTPPVSPIPEAGAGLAAIPSGAALYTLDTRRGVLADLDPVTLVNRGGLLSLASQLSAGTSTVDEAGTLWAIDNATGDLTRFAGGSRSVRRGLAQPGRSILAVANGSPVVVDPAGRKAMTIDRDTGRVRDTVELDLRPDDTVLVSGSARAERLYLVVGRNVLNICDLARGNCDKAIPLSGGGKFGAAVEAANRVFLPDYATGQVWIVDLAQSRVVAKPTVLTPGPFQLLTRDGVVFYNDTNSERAGVLRLDGAVVPVAKYNPAEPDKGVTTPRTDPANPPGDPTDPPADPRNPGDQNDPPRDPGDPPDPNDSGDPGDPNDPGDPPDPNDPGDPPDPGDPNDPPGPALEIVMSTVNPTVDDVVTLRVDNTSGPTPVAASWNFGDNEQGSGVTTTHQWQAPDDAYLVSVTATLPDGRQAATSVTVTVTETPTVRLTVSIPDDGGTITSDSGGLNCPAVCEIAVRPDTQVTLTAAPDGDHELGSWGGACAGTAATCDVTVSADTAVTYTFTRRPDPQVALTVTPGPPGRGTITGPGINCPPTCTANVDQGAQIRLTANPALKHRFDSWALACAGQDSTCDLTINANTQVSANFTRIVIATVDCSPPGSVTVPGCGVTLNFPNDTSTIRWQINGQPRSDANDRTFVGLPCDFGTSIDLDVTVTTTAGEQERVQRAAEPCD